MKRIDPVFVVILLAALGLRAFTAATVEYVHDEVNTAIPLADTISFTPGQLHLPLRGENHGALPAYVVHAGRSLFGTAPLASRALHVLLGLGTIALIYRLALQWFGVDAARWAAALMAFNEYYLDVSARATAHVPHLFFVTAAIFAFSRFLAVHRPVFLYAAGLSLGLAFYCKEHSALLLPVFLVTLLLPQHRPWLRGRHVYAAAAMWLLVISPDLLWNVTATEETRVSYGVEARPQATYSRHLQRIGGVGLSAYPAMFYGRSAVRPLHQAVTGRQLMDETSEYRSMNPVLGALMLAGVVVATVRYAGPAVTPFLLLAFWSVFLFFTFIEKGSPPGRLDPVSWIWVEATLMPAVVLTGWRLSTLTGAGRIAAWSAGAAALAYAVAGPALGLAGASIGGGQAVFAGISHVIQLAAQGLVDFTRERPLRALALAAGAGAILAWVAAVAVRWARRRP